MVLVIVLFVVLLSYVNPAVNFIDAWRDSRAARSQLAELRIEEDLGESATYPGGAALAPRSRG